jgi:hypothetical protein
MKKALYIALAVVALTVSALAQAPSAPPSPQEQALSGKLMVEINENIQLRTALVQAQQQVVDLQKQLAAKNAPPKKDEPKK